MSESATASLAGQAAIVTGAGGAIGRATCLALAGLGVNIAAVDRVSEGLDETMSMLSQSAVEATAWIVDIAEAWQVESMVDEVVALYRRLDIAFNNAGVEGSVARLHEYGLDDWRRVVDVNLNGTFYSMKYEAAAMSKAGSGSIINNSSILGVVGRPGTSAYVATKHAILGLTKSAALDYAPSGIRVNAIAPGFVSPGMIDRVAAVDPARVESARALQPMGRFGTPEEVAAAVCFLASPAASLMTGATLVLDGGFIAR